MKVYKERNQEDKKGKKQEIKGKGMVLSKQGFGENPVFRSLAYFVIAMFILLLFLPANQLRDIFVGGSKDYLTISGMNVFDRDTQAQIFNTVREYKKEKDYNFIRQQTWQAIFRNLYVGYAEDLGFTISKSVVKQYLYEYFVENSKDSEYISWEEYEKERLSSYSDYITFWGKNYLQEIVRTTLVGNFIIPEPLIKYRDNLERNKVQVSYAIYNYENFVKDYADAIVNGKAPEADKIVTDEELKKHFDQKMKDKFKKTIKVNYVEADTQEEANNIAEKFYDIFPEEMKKETEPLNDLGTMTDSAANILDEAGSAVSATTVDVKTGDGQTDDAKQEKDNTDEKKEDTKEPENKPETGVTENGKTDTTEKPVDNKMPGQSEPFEDELVEDMSVKEELEQIETTPTAVPPVSPDDKAIVDDITDETTNKEEKPEETKPAKDKQLDDLLKLEKNITIDFSHPHYKKLKNLSKERISDPFKKGDKYYVYQIKDYELYSYEDVVSTMQLKKELILSYLEAHYIDKMQAIYDSKAKEKMKSFLKDLKTVRNIQDTINKHPDLTLKNKSGVTKFISLIDTSVEDITDKPVKEFKYFDRNAMKTVYNNAFYNAAFTMNKDEISDLLISRDLADPQAKPIYFVIKVEGKQDADIEITEKKIWEKQGEIEQEFSQIMDSFWRSYLLEKYNLMGEAEKAAQTFIAEKYGLTQQQGMQRGMQQQMPVGQ